MRHTRGGRKIVDESRDCNFFAYSKRKNNFSSPEALRKNWDVNRVHYFLKSKTDFASGVQLYDVMIQSGILMKSKFLIEQLEKLSTIFALPTYFTINMF